MVGMGGTIIDATSQLAPIFIGMLAMLIASMFGILAATPLRAVLRRGLRGRRQRRNFSGLRGKRRPAPAHVPMQA